MTDEIPSDYRGDTRGHSDAQIRRALAEIDKKASTQTADHAAGMRHARVILEEELLG